MGKARIDKSGWKHDWPTGQPEGLDPGPVPQPPPVATKAAKPEDNSANFAELGDVNAIAQESIAQEPSRTQRYLDIDPKVGGASIGSLLAVVLADLAQRLGTTLDPVAAIAYAGLLAFIGGWLANRATRRGV